MEGELFTGDNVVHGETNHKVALGVDQIVLVHALQAVYLFGGHLLSIHDLNIGLVLLGDSVEVHVIEGGLHFNSPSVWVASIHTFQGGVESVP